jgi:hypothetical protein
VGGIGLWPLAEEIQRFVHDQNIALYRRLITESELNPPRDEDQHKMLLTLRAEELATDMKAKDIKSPLDS